MQIKHYYICHGKHGGHTVDTSDSECQTLHDRCLLRKLLHYESLKDGFPPSGKASPADSGSKTQVTAMETNPEPAIIKSKSKKKSTGGGDKKKTGTAPTVSKEIIGTLKVLHL